MAELAPIRDLVERFAQHTEAGEILREVYKRRPAIMVGELLDKLRLFEQAAKQPERREGRSLKNHPDAPRVR